MRRLGTITGDYKMNAAAVILCAGKGTRMNDESQNKVCFDCAGIPVIKRIIDNMRSGGISLFVIVVGHLAESVMRCLDGEPGVVYAYQKEQKGTGHAALCGLNALRSTGYSGQVVISMGDKIISSDVIRELLNKPGKAVWGVQSVNLNYHGGRVVIRNNKPYGVVELPDAVLMSLAGIDENDYKNEIKKYRLNEKKAAKILETVAKNKPQGTKSLCGEIFSAREIIESPYANAGLYRFDIDLIVSAIGTCNSQNAQGEVYLTDTLEWFASKCDVDLLEVDSADDMLTYSTKPDLCRMSRHFMKKASEFISEIQYGKYDSIFVDLYQDTAQKKRYLYLLSKFIEKSGDKKVIITRAPGRVNLMGRHIDHRGGSINVMAIDRDSVFVVSPRDDDTVNISDIDNSYPDRSFDIDSLIPNRIFETWLDYLADPDVSAALSSSRGDWSNYVKSAVSRVKFETDAPICGMDMMSSGNIPVAAGLSSSSSIVVAVMEAITALNCINYSDSKFVSMCGEGEWFVGSRGGSGDHAAMKCAEKGRIIHLGFKPFRIGKTVHFSDRYAVIVANSMIQAKKSEGSKNKFNAKVASYEVSFIILKRKYPEYDLKEFRDLALIRPYSKIYEMLKSLPETMTRSEIREFLPEFKDQLERLFMTHDDPSVYNLRAVALYGISECERSERFIPLLEKGDYCRLGQMMKISHNGDRIREYDVSDSYLDKLIESDADIALECGAYECSTEQIDFLCDILAQTDGVLGSEIVGAGLGGCVVALVEKDKSADIIDALNEKYYDLFGYDHRAEVYVSAPGSRVIY